MSKRLQSNHFHFKTLCEVRQPKTLQIEKKIIRQGDHEISLFVWYWTSLFIISVKMRRGAFRFTSGQCVCFIKSTRFKFLVHYENFWSYGLGRFNGTVVLARCFKLKSFLSCVLKSRKLKITKILQILLFLVNLSQLECHLYLNPRGLVFLNDFLFKSFH